jgi:large repetitive protein
MKRSAVLLLVSVVLFSAASLHAQTFQANPTTLNFFGPSGSTLLSPQYVALTNTDNTASHNWSVVGLAALAVNQPWLILSCPNNTSINGVQSCSGQTGSSLSVNVNATTLPVGNTTQIIQVLSDSSINITVNVCIGPSCIPPPTVTPTVLTFNVGLGSSASGTLTINSGGASTWTASATTNSGGNWLSVSSSGNVGGTASVTANASGLSQGTYTGTISVNSGGTSTPVSVTLNVSSTQASTFVVGTPSISLMGATGAVLSPVPLPLADDGHGALGWTATVSGGSWLSLTDGSGNPLASGSTPTSAAITINTSGLAAGPYSGSVVFSIPGATNPSYTVQVQLTLSAPVAGSLSAVTQILSQSTLTFIANQGSSPAPASISVTQTGGTGSVNWVAFPEMDNGLNWLTVSPNTSTTPSTTTVTVNSAALAPGNYNGRVFFSGLGLSSQVVFGVSLSVNGAGAVTTSLTSLSFAAAQSGAAPASQNLTVTTTGGNWTANSSASWLSANPASGGNGASVAISVNQSGLAQGTYNGTIVFSSTGLTSQTVNVSLTVSAAASLTVTPTSLTFTGAQGTSIASQSLGLGSTGTSIAFTASTTVSSPLGGTWLSVSPGSGNTPSNVTVSVSTSGLAVGTYGGTVNLSPSGVSVPVTLTITPGVALTASPTSLTFTGAAGSAVQGQIVTITAPSPVSWSPSVTTNSGGNWLSISGGGTTPGTLTVAASTTGLAVGTYTGTIQVTSSAASNTPSISVTLTVTPPGTLAVSANTMTFQTAPGGSPATQTFTISNSASGGAAIPWSASVSIISGGGNWLSISPSSGATPATITVTASAGSLATGTYTGAIAINSSAASNGQSVFVTMTVGAPALTASPSTLTFTGAAGGAPAAQSVAIGSTGGSAISWTAAAQSGGSGWLTVAPTSGQTPSNVQVSANIGALTPGTYSGTVIFTSSDGSSSQTVNVKLVVNALSILGVGPSSLQFLAAPAATAALTNTFDVVNLGNGSMSFAAVASTQSGGNWLSVSPASGNAPATLTVTANPAGLSAGSYLGTIVVTPSGSTSLNGPQTLIVTLAVGAPAIYPGGIVDAGSFAPDNSAAPFELMSLFGVNLAASTTVAQNLPLPTLLGSTQVLVNGTPAPLFFVSSGQINFQMPAVTGNAATIAVVSGGMTSTATQLSLVTVHPAIFPVSGGQGLGQILNQDFSTNSPSNPASAGQTIQMFATGLGATSPSLPAGQAGSSAAPFNSTVLAPTVTIGGISAKVTFSAAAPGLAGVYQVNAVVPAGLPSGGFAAVQIVTGGRGSNQVMVAVK